MGKATVAVAGVYIAIRPQSWELKKKIYGACGAKEVIQQPTANSQV
jgi:hypothetical protein